MSEYFLQKARTCLQKSDEIDERIRSSRTFKEKKAAERDKRENDCYLKAILCAFISKYEKEIETPERYFDAR